ncbi:flagellar hook-basal body complex protein FliE [Heliobacterium gestii]|uniref:Flagellar hook-basal body complex protein FliE n=1 Tax=Heliomicrobium gestii TaxID=2699 RepID=A0A845LA01_HELGE|nr:flagellar hook-basal body complex protein FliE [Heliomicrobium gestii]MBM7867104.1 flagellar hook-basal body complex protein FliE [Heliomicrobium gestii]MZP43482.1 flagellar hook-basal body complex protein FliE [Heliomicrobium gestii]
MNGLPIRFEQLLPYRNSLDKVEKPDMEEKVAEGNGKNFSSFLQDALNNVNDLNKQADAAAADLAAGKPIDLHQVVIASEKAGIATQLTLQVRNKVMEAYQEIMRMQV